MSNLLVIHGGGTTAVINASLYGVLQEAEKSGVNKVLGAKFGTGGFLREEFYDLTKLSEKQREALLTTPGSAIGSSRDVLEDEDYERMAWFCQKHHISAVLINGGNGSMDTCGKLWRYCKPKGIAVMGIPKTMDNDIAITDHSPGFPSVARFMATSVAELCVDVQSNAMHVVVAECLGRNAGWATAASALAEDCGYGPDLIYVPEVAFDETRFLDSVAKRIEEKACGVVVVSEGLRDTAGQFIVPELFTHGRITYYGDVSAHLAKLITQKLGFKARSEKPGLFMRSNMALVSRVDREEAILVGRAACRAALKGEGGKMIGLRRLPGPNYAIETFLIPLEELAFKDKTLPREFINAHGDGVTEAFKDWCRPLLGGPLPKLLPRL